MDFIHCISELADILGQQNYTATPVQSSPLKNPSQTSSAMFADHMVLEGVEERARTTCNQARKNAIQRS
ncbi:hypothetical protein WGE90_21795, partial [Xanthomonas euvesicatoria pv. euvesicatoria]|uniref:hypothetical protein n=1 Tax=Xanthomonas euvesicatoria TaxID=456327 RepID=UPI0032C1589C